MAGVALAAVLAGCGGAASAGGGGAWTDAQERAFKHSTVARGHSQGWLECALPAAEAKWPNHFDYATTSDIEVILQLSDECDVR